MARPTIGTSFPNGCIETLSKDQQAANAHLAHFAKLLRFAPVSSGEHNCSTANDDEECNVVGIHSRFCLPSPAVH